MDLLLDTHTLLWWFADDAQLSGTARKLIADRSNRVMISTASVWEIATKYRLGKLPKAETLLRDLSGYLTREGFEVLQLTLSAALRAGLLPGLHRDPFDRMLVAQALEGDLLLVSIDARLDGFGPRRAW